MNEPERHVDAVIQRLGPLEAFRQLVAENDAAIRQPELGNGRALAAARTAIYTRLVRHWAAEQHRRLGYDKPFAVAAVGGTGREEMTPCSDNDFALLFDGTLEGNEFLVELQRQAINTGEFEKARGFKCHAFPFSLEGMPALAGKDLNSFLDLRAVHDPGHLVEEFRQRIRATFDSFEHFLHVRSFWRAHWAEAAAAFEQIDRFDIKNDGLRVFLAGIWTLAGKNFCHSHDIYRSLDDERDLEAYHFLLRIRMFVHARRKGGPRASTGGNHPEDLLGFEDFDSFGELLGPEADERRRFEFANEVRRRLISARRRVASYAKGVIEQELKGGREIRPHSPIVCGLGGLSHRTSCYCQTDHERSRAALSLLLAAQRYDLPIDATELQATFRNAGDWLVRVPELAELFYETRGSLAKSFAFLSQIDGAEERLFPGYARFESSFDERVNTERRFLRSALERHKTEALERYVQEGHQRLADAIASERPIAATQYDLAAQEAALLDADQLAAIKLALKTKRLPVTTEDQAASDDPSREFYDRFSTGLSGVALPDYYRPFASEAGFRPETLELTEFLIANHRLFKQCAQAGLSGEREVKALVDTCGDEQRLRCLFVFGCADRAEWNGESTDPGRWLITRELFQKAMAHFIPAPAPAQALRAAGFSPDQVMILEDLGKDFFGGVYRPYARRFGAHLVMLGEDQDFEEPKALLLSAGVTALVGVAARDYPGLAATISGAFARHGIELRQAHFFSAARYRLALDFFHLAMDDRPLPSGLLKSIEDAIRERLHISEADEAALPRLKGRLTLEAWHPGLYRLQFETGDAHQGLLYALACKVHRHLRANIFGLTAHGRRGKAFIAVYHNLPAGMTLDQAQRIVAETF